MLFKYQKSVKIVNSLNLNILKKNNKKIAKRRRFTLNKKDSWRSPIYFNNPTSIGYFSFKFNTLFNLFLLKNKNYFNNYFFFKNDIIIKDFNIFNINFNIYFFLLFYKNFFFFIPINIYNNNILINFYFNKDNSNLEIYNSFLFWLNFSLISLVKSWFNNILKVSYNYIFLKLKYKGKNYRWHRKKKGIVLRFGHSHLIYSKKPNSIFLKKKGRMKIIFFGTNIELIYVFLRNLIKWKPSNVYTGRGLRLSRQRLLRKSGEISAYR